MGWNLALILSFLYTHAQLSVPFEFSPSILAILSQTIQLLRPQLPHFSSNGSKFQHEQIFRTTYVTGLSKFV
jgi:hypothetical protein